MELRKKPLILNTRNELKCKRSKTIIIQNNQSHEPPSIASPLNSLNPPPFPTRLARSFTPFSLCSQSIQPQNKPNQTPKKYIFSNPKTFPQPTPVQTFRKLLANSFVETTQPSLEPPSRTRSLASSQRDQPSLTYNIGS